MNWQEVWHAPFHTDHYGWIYDKDEVPVFTFDCPEDETEDRIFIAMARNITNLINGGEGEKYEDLHIEEGCDLWYKNREIGSFRGWGHMCGGLKMPAKEAAETQDDLIKFVLSKISK